MTGPEISVVMGVFNGQKHLKQTIQSVLSQRGADFEFIIVNDGSTDGSEQIVREAMQVDQRIMLLNQSNLGLTRALIAGCEKAKGKFIARQDVGDTSLPNRLQNQLNVMRKNNELAMLSSAVMFLAPDGEELYTVSLTEQDATQGLKNLDLKTIKGPPHHGSVMFRKDIYQKVGGYRREFLVAQDIDLWTRMIEYGQHNSLPDVLYCATWNKGSISASQRKRQIKTTQLIFRCCRARRASGSDKIILDKLKAPPNPSVKTQASTAKSDSNFYYFLGSNLFNRNPNASSKYLQQAVQLNPFNWKAKLKLMVLKWHETA
jgi:glycosyltransferase involved in cell wall biosynthesis